MLHVHYAMPNAVSAVLARQIVAPQPLPVVTTLHGTDVTLVGNDPNYLETTRWGIVQSDAVTAVSESLRQTTIEQLGIQSPIDVVPNFIDPARYEQARSSPGARRWAKPGERLLVHISNFRPVKRVIDVVEVFQRVRDRVPCRLLMVGDGPERGKVEQHCREQRPATRSPSSAACRWSRRCWWGRTSSCCRRRPSRSASPPWRRWAARCR